MAVSCTGCNFTLNKANDGGNGGGAISAVSNIASDEEGRVNLDIHESTFSRNEARGNAALVRFLVSCLLCLRFVHCCCHSSKQP